VRFVDFYFTVPLLELTALEQYHALVERSLPELIAVRGLPTWDGMEETKGRTVVAQLYQQALDTMLPGVLRDPVLLSAWTIYEAALVDVLFKHKLVNFSLDRGAKIPPSLRPHWEEWCHERKHFSSTNSIFLFSATRRWTWRSATSTA
jgi:hypothetical protein